VKIEINSSSKLWPNLVA